VQIVPLRFLSYRYKKERSVAVKIRQNPFSAGHDAPPDPLVSWRGDTRHHTPPHSAPTHLRRSPCVPLRIPARSMHMAPYKMICIHTWQSLHENRMSDKCQYLWPLAPSCSQQILELPLLCFTMTGVIGGLCICDFTQLLLIHCSDNDCYLLTV